MSKYNADCQISTLLYKLLYTVAYIQYVILYILKLSGALPVPSVVYTTLMSYLLTWKLILTLMSKASAELCSRYSAYLRVKNSLKPLMETLFHVMPMKVSAYTNNNNTQCLLDSLKSARKVCNFMKDFFFRTQCEGHEEKIFLQKEKKKKICSLVNFHIFSHF